MVSVVDNAVDFTAHDGSKVLPKKQFVNAVWQERRKLGGAFDIGAFEYQ